MTTARRASSGSRSPSASNLVWWAVLLTIAGLLLSMALVPSDAVGCDDGSDVKDLRYYTYATVFFLTPFAAPPLIFGAIALARPRVQRSVGTYVVAVLGALATFAVVVVASIVMGFVQIGLKGCGFE